MIYIDNLVCDKQAIGLWREQGLVVNLVDLREFYEDPYMDDADLRIALDALIGYDFSRDQKYVLFCQTGQRAKAAVIELKKIDADLSVYFFEGGVEAWMA